MTRVAIDLIGEGPPLDGGLLDGLPGALDADPRLTVTVVAPTDWATAALAERGIMPGERVRLVAAGRGVSSGPEAIREVRARRDSGVRVAAKLVRDGQAGALVSVAPIEAVLAAAGFTFGLLPGATRASAAAVISTDRGPVVLCDAGGSVDVTADELAQFALAGAELAAGGEGAGTARVGLLSARPALADPLRRAADDLLVSLGLDYIGPVPADRMLTGDGVDVVVTDGYTGDILLTLLGGVASRRAEDGSDLEGETIVLGVDGVAAWAGGPLGPAVTALPAALAAAAGAARSGLPDRVQRAMATLVRRRRVLAGLPR